MSYTLFVSVARLKKLTGVYENLFDDYISPYVLQGQDIYIQDLLGTTFYTELKDKVINNTLSQKETDLLNEYIAPCLSNYALYLALPSIHYQIKNKSVLMGTSEDGTPVTMGDIKYLRNQILDTAQFYRERTRQFLRAYENDFPSYTNYDEDFMAPNRFTTYSQGLYIPKSRGCGYYDKNIDII